MNEFMGPSILEGLTVMAACVRNTLGAASSHLGALSAPG